MNCYSARNTKTAVGETDLKEKLLIDEATETPQ
jgi:hypothetical protein